MSNNYRFLLAFLIAIWGAKLLWTINNLDQRITNLQLAVGDNSKAIACITKQFEEKLHDWQNQL